jgi:streptogramin lyase
MRVVDEDGVHLTRVTPPTSAPSPNDFTFTEWPTGNFPDQIGVDSSNNIWFSQPNSPGNQVTKFDPNTQTFSFVSASPGSGPDGMIVDPINRVWSGCYYSGHLLQYTISSATLNLIPVPYAPSNPAIPTFSRSTHIWVTDHQNNRISEWDPNTSTWLNSLVMPTPGCWVVEGTEDAGRQTLYFSEYNVSQLAKKPWVGPITDIVLPVGGCAFPVYHRSRVFYSNWNTDRIGVYNVVSGAIVEYNYPIAGELGGPICKTKNNQVAVGTRNVGYIMVFDLVTGVITGYKIPTQFCGMKDGITSDKNGAIWFTESGVNKLGRLVLP